MTPQPARWPKAMHLKVTQIPTTTSSALSPLRRARRTRKRERNHKPLLRGMSRRCLRLPSKRRLIPTHPAPLLEKNLRRPLSTTRQRLLHRKNLLPRTSLHPLPCLRMMVIFSASPRQRRARKTRRRARNLQQPLPILMSQLQLSAHWRSPRISARMKHKAVKLRHSTKQSTDLQTLLSLMSR